MPSSTFVYTNSRIPGHVGCSRSAGSHSGVSATGVLIVTDGCKSVDADAVQCATSM